MYPGLLTATQIAEALAVSYEDTRLAAIPEREALLAELARRQGALIAREDGTYFERTPQVGHVRCGDCQQRVEASLDAIRAHVCSAWWEQ